MAAKLPDPEDINKGAKDALAKQNHNVNENLPDLEEDLNPDIDGGMDLPDESDDGESHSDDGRSKTSGTRTGGSTKKDGSEKTSKIPSKSDIAKKAMENTEAGQKAAEAADKFEKGKRSFQALKVAGGNIANAVSALISILANPITWIILAVALVILILIGASQVVGQNENAKNCISGALGGSISGVHVSDKSLGLTEEQREENAQTIGMWFMSNPLEINGGKPLSREQAAAIVGNMWSESGMNPAAIQNNRLPSTASNADVRGLNGQAASAVGLIQWTNDRMLGVVDKADEMGVLWSDATAQTSHIVDELEADNRGLGGAGFFDEGKTVLDYTRIFNRKYEGSCDIIGDENVSCGENVSKSAQKRAGENRVKNAERAYTLLSGGGGSFTGGGGGPCLAGGNEVDNSSVISLAISIAYPRDQKDRSMVVNNDKQGVTVAPQAYKDAKEMAGKISGDPDSDAPHLYASCDRFVATVIKQTQDPDFPWGHTGSIYEYLEANPDKWQRYDKKSEAQPGDVWSTTTRGHIIIYIGEYEGKDSIADASYYERVGVIQSAGYLNENMVDTSGRQYAGYRFIGTPINGTPVDKVTGG